MFSQTIGLPSRASTSGSAYEDRHQDLPIEVLSFGSLFPPVEPSLRVRTGLRVSVQSVSSLALIFSSSDLGIPNLFTTQATGRNNRSPASELSQLGASHRPRVPSLLDGASFSPSFLTTFNKSHFAPGGGGFVLILKYQLYPLSHRPRVARELGLLVDSPRELRIRLWIAL